MDDDASFGEGATQMDDGGLRRSIEVLIEAVAKEVKPGGFELKLAASTLRDLLQDPNPRSYSEAARAFAALDAETRRRIQANAESTATIYCTDSGRRVVVPHPKPQGEKVQRGGLLQALKVGFGSIIGKDRGAKR